VKSASPDPDQPPPQSDLARIALQWARSMSSSPPSRNPAAPVRRPRRGSSGRDVVPLGQAVADLSEQLNWASAAAGGDVCARWPALVGPELASHVQAAGFDAATRTLHLVSDSPAHATHLRLEKTALIAWLNDELAVRHNTEEREPVIEDLHITISSRALPGQAPSPDR
jgi:predicted nucleic acid-binding Zn ribbon protein